MTKSKTIYLVLFVLLCFAVYEIPRIETSGEVYPVDISGEYYFLKQKADLRFPTSSYLRIYFEKLSGESDLRYYREMERYVEALEGFEWTDRVLSPTRVQDVRTDSMEFASETIYSSDDASAERLDRLLHTDVLFHKFFLSHDGSGNYLYLFYPEGSWKSSYHDELEKTGRNFPEREVLPMGMEILEEHLARFGVRELLRLGSIAILVVLLVEMVFFRSFLYGFLFSTFSYLPALYIMSLLPLLGISFSIFLIPVPILTLVLSTTYTLHIVSYITARPEAPIRENLARVFPVVSAAAATTLFGFVTMLLSSLDQMKDLGFLMSAGVLLSLTTAWFAIPPLLPGYLKRVSAGRKILKIPMSRSLSFVLLFIAALGLSGLLSFEDERFVLRWTVRDNTIREYIDTSRRVTGASHQFTVLLDTGEEFGFVSPRKYKGLLEVQKSLDELSYGTDTLSITHFVNWINGKIEGESEPVVPKSEMEIGESLELLFSTDTGFHPESLVSPDYSAVRLEFLIDTRGSGSWKSDLAIEETRDEIYALFKESFPDTEVIVLSDAVQILDSYNVTRESITTSLFLFYPVVFLFLLILFRSFLPAFISVLPSFFSAILYLGLMGFFDFNFSILASVCLCMLIGVCIDDSVVLVQFHMKHKGDYANSVVAMGESLKEVGSVIVKTTVIIVLGVLVLLFSSHREVLQNSILLIITFLFATMLTLFFIPTMLVHNKKERVHEKEK